jgi:hypothetical protein
MTAVGLEWTDAEQAFAKACQAEMGVPETGMAMKVMPVLGEITAGGSTDVGDISWTVPTVVFGWPTMPLGVGLHTWPVTACGGMSIGDKASLATARILAGAGHDLMTQPDLLAAAKATPSLSILYSLLNSTGLLPALTLNTGSFTVFAPSNTAFASVPAYISSNATLLTKVLLYHVINGRTYASDLPNNTAVRAWLAARVRKE